MRLKRFEGRSDAQSLVSRKSEIIEQYATNINVVVKDHQMAKVKQQNTETTKRSKTNKQQKQSKQPKTKETKQKKRTKAKNNQNHKQKQKQTRGTETQIVRSISRTATKCDRKKDIQ